MTLKTFKKTIQEENTTKLKEIKDKIKSEEKIFDNKREAQEFAEFCLSYFDQIKNEEARKIVAAILNYPLIFKALPELNSLYYNFILNNITDQNGQIRQRCVNITRYFTVFIDNSLKLKFLDEIFTLIDKYKAQEKDLIDRAKPCVYKSLMLLLEQIVLGKKEEEQYQEKASKYLQKFYDMYFPENSSQLNLQSEDDFYYEAMEILNEGKWKTALNILVEGKEKYPESIQIYAGLAITFHYIKNERALEIVIEEAYDKIKKIFPKWPQEMPWGVISNRKFLRIMDFKALVDYNQGNIEEAKQTYKLILQLNPGDNQGIRYFLAGLYEGMSPEQTEKILQENGEKMEDIMEKQNKIHHFFKPESEDNENKNSEEAAFYWHIK